MALRTIVSLTLMVVAVGCAGLGRSPSSLVPGIDPNDVGLMVEVQSLDEEIAFLEMEIGTRPPQIESEKQHALIFARWSAAVDRSIRLMNVDLNNPELMVRTGDLFRLGHNLNVPDASAFADRTISRLAGRCLTPSRPRDCGPPCSARELLDGLGPGYALTPRTR